ncbi:MAG: HsdR family type I site-specific deoxyribonuclease [Candidatus Nitrosopelagicus sp.]|nr:HsdR family type I site-specific deoxyribonuclease [Candidatus Nitrosopelagicus sp.]
MKVGQLERKTQDRIVKFFQDKLNYEYLGNWEERTNNSNIEEELLTKFLKGKYSQNLINKAVNQLQKLATNQSKSLYDINKEIYSALRYGIDVKDKAGDKKQTIQFINWNEPLKNDFYIAEEVTVAGVNEKRPDIVLYVNGIVLGVLELKRSKVSVSEGIRQNLDNQRPEFIQNFFGTIQLIMAGNDSEGLRYGVIETPEKYFLNWKEQTGIRNKLDSGLSVLCEKQRFLELIHDFIVFDRGQKKIARHNQFFAVKESQSKLKKREGGIIWHTQGSGKTLTMVWLAKWIRENIHDSRVLLITDREELDDQIEERFHGIDEAIYRTKSGKDLINKLDKAEPWLICSLIHKFRSTHTDDDEFRELVSKIPKGFKAKGDIYVFVDECHRTQSGKLHEAMKSIVPNSLFVGFTGTPLFKKDKKNSLEVFGGYIHTYKYDEAVKDNVILDLQYEAREIDQKLTSKDKVDKWFEAKTNGLTDFAMVELKKKWATMQKVLSSKSRLQKIAADIMLDLETKPRLSTGKGNALLVAGSIYEACKYYELFQDSGLKKCAIITSFNPHISSIKGETVSLDEDTDNIVKYEVYQKMIGDKKIEDFEREVKEKFVKQPEQMKLLIVVDKLLTGFDAPPATYIYIDKSMRDHGLFQAICRVNRLDGEDKDYGYIVDYKDLFKSLEKSVVDYTSEAFDEYEEGDVKGLLKDRIVVAREKLDTSIENIRELCEPVKPPKASEDYIDYFAPENELQETTQRRIALYKMSSSLIRAYSNLANEMELAGYSKQEASKILEEVTHYKDVRDEIKLASGEHIDLKAYEPSMRHLLDTYIDSQESKKISEFDDLTLVEMIVQSGIADTIRNMPKRIRKNNDTVAEVIENNVRKIITEEKPTNPKFYEKISLLLKDIISSRKKKVIKYEEYLEKISDLCKKLKDESAESEYPESIETKGQKSLYDNLGANEEIALAVDKAIITKKADSWRGNKIKEKQVNLAIAKALKKFKIHSMRNINSIFEIVKEPRNGY